MEAAGAAPTEAAAGLEVSGMPSAQTSFLDEIIVDNFAGGGGASTGMELALGRPVDIAVNHDPAAILMHQTNHPYTEHHQASVWDIDPRTVCRGRPVGLAWFSPDCKHFSKAKGGKPVDKNIRGLAWIALRWAGLVRPRVIILENVEEFQTWGPVRRGKPIKSKQGQTFRKFIRQLRDLGYDVQWRELVAADYGVPTIRKRFFLIARCDGRPVVWPEATHAPRDSGDVRSGRKLPWRSAAEIIDWSLPCPSIFDTKEQIMDRYGVKVQRPLADNTMRRAARGLDKFVLKEAEPFLVTIGYGERAGQRPRVQDIRDPAGTSVSTGKQAVAAPVLIQYHQEKGDYTRGQTVDRPLCTVDAANRYGAVTPYLVKYHGSERHGQGMDEPLHTVTARDREALAAPYLSKFYGGVVGTEMSSPLPTVTAIDHNAVSVAHIVKAAPGMELHHWPEVRALLNRYCGYHLGDDEIILLWIGGEAWFIADVGLRMLTPRELYAANGFPPDYIIERDYLGNAYPRYEQVARCGNAVPPPFATALVRANLPELCPTEIITTMAQLERVVAV